MFNPSNTRKGGGGGEGDLSILTVIILKIDQKTCPTLFSPLICPYTKKLDGNKASKNFKKVNEFNF